MPIFLLPLLILGVAYVGGRAARSRAAEARRPAVAGLLPAPPPAVYLVAGEWSPSSPTPPPYRSPAAPTPSPLVVLDQYLQAGQRPPPSIVLFAIAEAEILGRSDVARELVEAFVRPVVETAERAAAARAAAALMSPPPTASPGTPYASHDHPGRGHHHHGHHHGHQHGRGQAPAPTPTSPPAQFPTTPSTTPPYPYSAPGYPGSPGHLPGSPGEQADGFELPDWLTQGGGGGGPAAASRPRAIGRPEDARVDLLGPQAPPITIRASAARAAAAAAAEAAANPPPSTLTVSGRSSPIEGVPADEWAEFAGRVAREQPQFSSNHHVGQYRQRRSRLAELGIDPDSIVGSTDGQARALEADMVDAYCRARDSGMLADFQGTVVEVPADDGRPVPVQATLSGVLGVIQAAGLEGALSWLEAPEDRSRFRGTTAAFWRTNGVF